MKKLLIFILAALLLVGCTQAGETDDTTDTAPSVETNETVTEDATETDTETETESETETETVADTEPSTEEVPESETAAEEIADLRGEWIEVGYENAETYMMATITDDVIEIYWNMNGGETIALYWAGTYIAPTVAGDYTWDSANDHARTDLALFASGDDTKTFSYSGSEITYAQTAMGVTTTIHLARVEK